MHVCIFKKKNLFIKLIFLIVIKLNFVRRVKLFLNFLTNIFNNDNFNLTIV